MLQQLKQAAKNLLAAQLANLGLALHSLALGAHIAFTEDDPIQTYMESGPSLFCSCCGERWHAFSHAACPNGCPWVYSVFRAPAWAEDQELLDRVQERHRGRMRATGAGGAVEAVGHWPTADGKVPRA